MSVKNGVWHNAQVELPEAQQEVLIVKQLKSGQRTIGLGYCIPNYQHTNPLTKEITIAPHWVCGGNNNVIYWMPLPGIPEVGEVEIR